MRVHGRMHVIGSVCEIGSGLGAEVIDSGGAFAAELQSYFICWYVVPR